MLTSLGSRIRIRTPHYDYHPNSWLIGTLLCYYGLRVYVLLRMCRTASIAIDVSTKSYALMS